MQRNQRIDLFNEKILLNKWNVSVAALFMTMVSLSVGSPSLAHDDPAYAHRHLQHFNGTWFQDNFTFRLDWMEDLGDDLKLSELSLPGTHDTMADPLDPINPANLFVRTQSLTLREQLLAGIRVLDIRAKLENGRFNMYHGSFFLDATFEDDVYPVVKNFLEENPSETVIIILKNSDPSNEGHFENHLADFLTEDVLDFLVRLPRVDVTNTCASLYEEGSPLRKPCKDPQGNDVQIGDTYVVKENGVPTLGESRGKMVIQHRAINTDFLDLPVGGNGNSDTLENYLLKYMIGVGQDDWQLSVQHDLPEKWESIKKAMNKIRALSTEERQERFSINFLSAAGAGLVFPYWVASGHIGQETWASRQATGCVSGWLAVCDAFSPGYWDAFPRVDCFADACTIAFEGTNTLFRNRVSYWLYSEWIRQGSQFPFSADLHLGVVMSDFPGDGLIGSIVLANKLARFLPLECDEDCNGNGQCDEQDLREDPEQDADGDGIIDSCQVSVLYVDANSPGNNTGISMKNAFTDLASALGVARARQRDGTTPLEWIFVAEGTYGRKDGETFELYGSTNLFGGFPSFDLIWVNTAIARSLRELPATASRLQAIELEWNVLPSILKNILIKDVWIDQQLIASFPSRIPDLLLKLRDPVRHRTVLTSRGDEASREDFPESVVTVDGANGVDYSTLLDGFTIRNGRAFGSGNEGDERGGGMFIRYGVPTIRNCMFIDNAASIEGGAIYINNQRKAGAKIIGCTFQGNRVAAGQGNRGGAISYDGNEPLVIVNCGFYENWISGNQADRRGSAIYGNVRLINCTVRANSGSVPVWFGDRSSMVNTLIWGNSTNSLGNLNSVDRESNWIQGENIGDPRFLYTMSPVDADQHPTRAAVFGNTVMGPRAGMILNHSPCVNNGTLLEGEMPAFDALGHPRVMLSDLHGQRQVDIGTTEAFIDFNNNRLPDSAELLNPESLEAGGVNAFVNLAPGGVATQSGEPSSNQTGLQTGNAWHAVDGDISPAFNSGEASGEPGTNSIAHFEVGNENAVWELDLGSLYRIRRIEIIRREGCCADNLRSGILRVFNGEDQVYIFQRGGSPLEHDSPFGMNLLADRISITVPQSAGTNYFDIAEVKVYGYREISTNLADCNGNGIFEALEEQAGLIEDCNQNNILDSCELAEGGDCDSDGILDECQPGIETDKISYTPYEQIEVNFREGLANADDQSLVVIGEEQRRVFSVANQECGSVILDGSNMGLLWPLQGEHVVELRTSPDGDVIQSGILSIEVASGNHWIVRKSDFSGPDGSTSVNPGETISLDISYWIRNPPSCSGCITTLLLGYKDTPVDCLISEVISTNGSERNNQITFPAPDEPGEYPVYVAYELRNCSQANDVYSEERALDRGALIGTFTVLGSSANFRRGDTDANGLVEITDPINNLAFQFLGTFTPPCMDAADFDDNGNVEITDAIANLSHQFLGTQAPAPPGKDTCGQDPTPNDAEAGDLGCLVYDQC